MAYPAVPYPSAPSSVSVQQAQPAGRPLAMSTGGDKQDTQQTTSTTPATPSGKRTFRSPFKSPLVPRSAAPSSTAFSAQNSAKAAMSPSKQSRASVPVTPTKSRPSRPAVPFKSPALTSSPAALSPSSSTAMEISQLERRLQHLRQARRYQQATLRGDKDGDGELERLCEKWKDTGRLAAEMLFERVGSPEAAGGGAFSSGGHDSFSSSWGFSAPASGSKHPSSDPWSSSWGFSSSPPGSDPFGPSPFPSSGFLSTSSRPNSTSDIVSTFKRSLDEEARLRGTTTQKLLGEMDDFEAEELGGDELEDPEAAVKRMLKVRTRKVKRSSGLGGSAAKRVKVDEVEEKQEEEEKLETDSDDELLDALDSLIGEVVYKEHGAGSGGAEEEQVDDAGEDEGEQADEQASGEGDALGSRQAKEWSVGEMLKSVGVDPGLFGWCEEGEGFE